MQFRTIYTQLKFDVFLMAFLEGSFVFVFCLLVVLVTLSVAVHTCTSDFSLQCLSTVGRAWGTASGL